ncbi:hypothetical protein Q4603_17005 [Zobellia galactanivorans]|nr:MULTISPECIES: hypothetical protein [Zobellia]MBU3025457.1 hypothetical protein [Zobellia galactanivorans]MDO6810326.1 hypothetical protein [Zobellia galactanivorans]
MLRKLYGSMVFLMLFTSVNAQNCTLDIGGKNNEAIKTIFQLNEEQISTMEALQGELEVQTKDIEGQIEKLLAEHPQSSEEDLIKLAEKYKVLQQQLVQAAYDSDKKLLSLFNSKQYERYLRLCNEAIRIPIKVIPKNYEIPEGED